MNVHAKTLRTPVGEIILAASDSAVVALVWDEAGLNRLGLRISEAGSSCALLESA
jgi:hypothetical protein